MKIVFFSMIEKLFEISLELFCKQNFLTSQLFLSCNLKLKSIKQTAPDMNRGLLSNFCWLTGANHVKFTEEYGMCHVLDKGILTNSLN